MQVRIEWIAGVVVAAGLGFFLLSVFSAPDVVEEEGFPRHVASGHIDRRESEFVADPRRRESALAKKPPRRDGQARLVEGRREEKGRPGFGPARRSGQPPAYGTENVRDAGSFGGGSTGASESGRRRMGSAQSAQGLGSGGSARRGELVEFLASKRLSLDDTLSGKGGGSVAEDGATVALDAEEGEGDVVLSVPLVESTEAEGYTQPIADEGVHVDADGGVEFPEDSVLAFPDAGNARGESGTIALEIEPNWNGSDPGDNSFVQVRELDAWQGKVALFRNGTGLRFVIFDAEGQEYGATAPIADWKQGDRHSVTATWDSDDGILSLYVDGVVAEQTSYSGKLDIPPGTPMFLGSNPRHHVPGAGATLQNFKVYGRALGPEEISGGAAPVGGPGPGEE